MAPRKPPQPLEFNQRLFKARDDTGMSLRDAEAHAVSSIYGPDPHLRYNRADLRGFSSEKIRRAEAGDIPQQQFDLVLAVALCEAYNVPLTDLLDKEHVERAARVAQLLIDRLPLRMAEKIHRHAEESVA